MTRKKRKRRSFTPEFKAEVVGLCRAGDRSVGQVAKDLDLTETAVREWARRAEIDARNCRWTLLRELLRNGGHGGSDAVISTTLTSPPVNRVREVSPGSPRKTAGSRPRPMHPIATP